MQFLSWFKEEYIVKQKKLCMCFVDLEKAFVNFEESYGMNDEKERNSRSICSRRDEPV